MVSLSEAFSDPVNGHVVRIVCPNSPTRRRGVPQALLGVIGHWFGTPVAVTTVRLDCEESPEAIQRELQQVGLAQNWTMRGDILAFVMECDEPTWDSLSGYEEQGEERGELFDCMRMSLWHRTGNSLSAC